MKTARLKHFVLAGVCVVSIALILPGCATPTLSGISSSKDPHAGYWAAATSGNEKLQEACAMRIAGEEFVRRVKIPMPSTMHELRAYKNLMLSPVEIRVSYARSVDLQGLPPSEIEQIDAYVAEHKEAQSIQGAKYSKEWADELSKLGPVMAMLDERVNKMIRGAEAKLRQGSTAEAEAAWQDIRKIDSDGAAVIELEKLLVVSRNKGRLGVLIGEIDNSFLKKGADQAKVFGTPASSEAGVKSCLAIVADADKAIAQFKDLLQTGAGEKFSAAEVDQALAGVSKGLGVLQGRCWSEQVRLLSAKKQFWAAHQYAEARLDEIAAVADPRRAATCVAAGDGYSQMLPAAMAELVNQANSHFAQDAYGISLTFCRMAEEMIQFARDRKISIPGDAQTWEKRSKESRKDAQRRIAAVMDRRLLIGGITPVTRENQRLSTKVYDRCSELLSTITTNMTRLAWAISVEKPGEKARPADYLLECNVPDFMIISQAPVEVERAVVKIGRDIREIPNPQYNAETNKKAPKTLFTQEVYLYQTIRKKHAKKARLQASLASVHAGQKKNILSLDTEFSDLKMKLEGVQMSSIEEQLDVPFMAPPRVSGARKDMVVDPWPKAVAPAVSSDVEIIAAIQTYAMNAIVDATIALASSYPVESLAAEAVRNAKLGNKYEAANSWGQCLEYCSELVAAEPGGESKDESWLAQKERMQSWIGELCRTNWKNCDSEVLKKMADLWSEAVRSAQDIPTTGR